MLTTLHRVLRAAMMSHEIWTHPRMREVKHASDEETWAWRERENQHAARWAVKGWGVDTP
jgi:hypothetical protein